MGQNKVFRVNNTCKNPLQPTWNCSCSLKWIPQLPGAITNHGCIPIEATSTAPPRILQTLSWTTLSGTPMKPLFRAEPLGHKTQTDSLGIRYPNKICKDFDFQLGITFIYPCPIHHSCFAYLLTLHFPPAQKTLAILSSQHSSPICVAHLPEIYCL